MWWPSGSREVACVNTLSSTCRNRGMGVTPGSTDQIDASAHADMSAFRYVCTAFPAAAYVLIQTLYKTGVVTESRAAHLIMEIMTVIFHLNNLFWL